MYIVGYDSSTNEMESCGRLIRFGDSTFIVSKAIRLSKY